ncbi:MAG: helix-turn-helix domain-containing protein, partial [Bacteroidales bacterium]|nr:helix-turn-helix domain-containing protein [Bacteroidales bacterium]
MAESPSNGQLFSDMLTRIIEANFHNEQFGVNELAQKTGLSRSHIHRRLKTLFNKSVSQFIREVRLEKAKELLEEGNLTGSEIAYKVGFGSPSYFIKSFHDYFGYPPGELKKHFHTDEMLGNEAEKRSLSEPEDLDLRALAKNNKKSVRKKIVRTTAAFIAIISIPVLFYFLFVDDDNALERFIYPDKELSIIVLPFKNLSNDPNNQYFADGIAEDILNNLYWITSLRVVSRTSAEQFRESNLSSGEIASMMNVNYVLEGSVRQYGEKTRLSVQLIDASRDNHLWSSFFDKEEQTDIIAIQDEIAFQVAS